MMGVLPALALFAWGSLGGMAMAAAMFLLPLSVQLAVTGTMAIHDRGRVVGSALTVALLGAIAGVVALTLPDTAGRGQAIVTGLTALGTAKGIVSMGREALSRLPD
jgi:hypothetical protein